MRWLWVLLIAASLGESTGLAQSSLAKELRLAGADYTALRDWALAKDFKIVWLNKEDFQLISRAAKLAFKVGSRKAGVNGLTAWLSFPIYARNDRAYISRLDLRTLIEPILYPPPPLASARIKTIALDPGHGGKDPGNQAGTQQEKKHTLLLAKEVRRLLPRAGLKGVLTRATDTFVELDQRPALAKRQRADLFVSLHYNSVAAGKNGVKGIELYCLTPVGATSTHAGGEGVETRPSPGNRFDVQNVMLAYQLQRMISKGLPVEDRGLLRARWAVLRQAQMPAVLVEGGFMSDPQEARRIYSDASRRQLAQAIVDGLVAYKRLVERSLAPRRTTSAPVHPTARPQAARPSSAGRETVY